MYYVYLKPPLDEKQTPEEIDLANGWSSQLYTVTGDRGQCNLYNTLSLDYRIVDELPFLTQLELANMNSEPCNDGFNKMLIKRAQKCDREKCIGRDGMIYDKGEFQFLYNECGNMKDCTEPTLAIIDGFEQSQGRLTSGTCLMRNGLGQKCFVSNIPQYLFEVSFISTRLFFPFYNYRKGAPTNMKISGPEHESMSLYPLLAVRIKIPGTNNALDENGEYSDYTFSEFNGYNFLVFDKEISFGESISYPQQLIIRREYEEIVSRLTNGQIADIIFSNTLNYAVSNTRLIEELFSGRYVHINTLQRYITGFEVSDYQINYIYRNFWQTRQDELRKIADSDGDIYRTKVINMIQNQYSTYRILLIPIISITNSGPVRTYLQPCSVSESAFSADGSKISCQSFTSISGLSLYSLLTRK